MAAAFGRRELLELREHCRPVCLALEQRIEHRAVFERGIHAWP